MINAINPFKEKGYVRVGNEIFCPIKKGGSAPSQAIKTPASPIPAIKRHDLEPVVEIRTNLACHPTTDVLKLNKLEKAFYSHLQMLNYAWIGVQNITLKIGADCRYTPDFSAIGFEGEFLFLETKSAFFRDDAKVKIKVAARMFAWAKFQVVRKEKSGWTYETIKP